jgi:hypothetical protein
VLGDGNEWTCALVFLWSGKIEFAVRVKYFCMFWRILFDRISIYDFSDLLFASHMCMYMHMHNMHMHMDMDM